MSSATELGLIHYAIVDEPQIEFGQKAGRAGLAVDPQLGLSSFGPFSSRLSGRWHPRKIRLLPICSAADFDSVQGALARLLDFEKLAEVVPYARVDYPGFEAIFRSKLDIHADTSTQVIADEIFELALNDKSAASGYRRVVEAIGQVVDDLAVGQNDVVAVYLPPAIVKKFRSFSPDFTPVAPKISRLPKRADGYRQASLFDILGEPDDGQDETLYHDLRRSIKVRCMRKDIASQIITDNFLIDDEGQPWAGKLWNVATSIFCKAGGIPWRLPTTENIAHCGIRFGVTRQGGQQKILIGLAQVFSASGELVALRAGNALKRGRSLSERGYHLSRDQARELILGVLADYENVTGRLPDRMLIHKSSPFDDDEQAGIDDAAAGIREVETVFVKSTDCRLLPEGGQPAYRGTVVPSSDSSAIIYVTGFIPSEKSWRGKHIPSPVEIVRHRSRRTLLDHATELIQLTKMNWNTTIFSTREPCTFTNASEIIGMLKELRPDECLKPSIRYYI